MADYKSITYNWVVIYRVLSFPLRITYNNKQNTKKDHSIKVITSMSKIYIDPFAIKNLKYKNNLLNGIFTIRITSSALPIFLSIIEKRL
jgi:hypothetical protein